MIKIRCMHAPSIGDTHRFLDGEIMLDMRGFPIAASNNNSELRAISTVRAIAEVGAHWSGPGESGYYVLFRE